MAWAATRGGRTGYLAVAGLAMTAVVVAGVLAMPGDDDLAAAREATSVRRLLIESAVPESLPAVPQGEALTWASEELGFVVRTPALLPDGFELAVVGVDGNAVVKFGGRTALLSYGRPEDIDKKFGDTSFTIRQAPKTDYVPAGMEPVALGVREQGAWYSLTTNIEPPGSDLSSSSFLRYTAFVDGVGYVLEISAPPGEVPTRDEVERMVRSMFE